MFIPEFEDMLYRIHGASKLEQVEKDLKTLAMYRFPRELAGRAVQELEAHGEVLKSRYGEYRIPNTQNWTDREAAEQFNSTVRRQALNAVSMPSKGTVPLALRKPWGQFLISFKSFTFNALWNIQLKYVTGNGDSRWNFFKNVGFQSLVLSFIMAATGKYLKSLLQNDPYDLRDSKFWLNVPVDVGSYLSDYASQAFRLWEAAHRHDGKEAFRRSIITMAPNLDWAIRVVQAALTVDQFFDEDEDKRFQVQMPYSEKKLREIYFSLPYCMLPFISAIGTRGIRWWAEESGAKLRETRKEKYEREYGE
jgi:hypothetical protein